ncbi:centrosomal protein of 192 kDa isoform X3 [Corythoichthys intestinalis]|uniref:centrosomal protein of 192 kDa isoform X3 n=1 Tax=Corythoichthys intestinalis TaxID=161448 RepID=UPI0025A4F551|nr:centrosomal protein of 192 kDa isoform X3 [Corythoichthys intestinalis]
MAESFYKLEDETFPSFLGKSLDSTNGRATLGNVTLGSGPGLPVAASTVAKIKPQSENRDCVDTSYLENREAQQASLQSSVDKKSKFALSFKDDMDSADDFIAAHRLSQMLVKVNVDESASRNQGSLVGLPPTQMGPVQGSHKELPTDLSTGLLPFTQFGHKDHTDKKVSLSYATTEKNNFLIDAVDSDHFSGSNSSFLENEKLMSVNRMNSDDTDDDIDLNNLPDDELELYLKNLVPSAMHRGTVDGQELPATVLPRSSDDRSNSISIEQYRHRIIDDCNQDKFQMPVVRLAATGMDSCPASDEDTEDEFESARQTSNSTRTRLLPSISRQLVGESNRPSFRPGLEGGSSDDEPLTSLVGPSLSEIEHRRSAEGQVVNHAVTAGDGGVGDGSSGSEESGNYGGVSTIPFSTTSFNVLRGLRNVGNSTVGENGDSGSRNFTGQRMNFTSHAEMGDRVGPVGNGEASTSKTSSSAESQIHSPVNWSMDRQEALDVMGNAESGMTTEQSVPVLVKNETGFGGSLQGKSNFSQLQDTQDNYHDPKVLPSANLRAGPCGNTSTVEASDVTSEDDGDNLSTSLEPKYFCQSFQQEPEDEWNNCPNNLDLEFQQGAIASHSVVYQNEEGQWVTDLAYCTSFEKEVGENALQNDDQFQTEDFLSPSDALEKIMKDQVEFEKEHQFMQEEQIVPASSNSVFQNDSSWRAGNTSHILMRASQVSSEFNPGDQSYLRLSLGQFFEQRSEALGCLGSGSIDGIKRPSFGYIITSPEKREPFALIHPSDFSINESSPHNVSMEVNETDKTLNPDDLSKTFEVLPHRVSPKRNTQPGPCEQEVKDHNAPKALLHSNEGPACMPSIGNQSLISPYNNSSDLMLSISAIASAMADASISTDPSQLAAMIMELSKKSRAKNGIEPSEPAGPKANPNEDQNGRSDSLHSTACVEDQSALNIEKYLKEIYMSGCCDTSVVQNTFDLSGWADNIKQSRSNHTEQNDEQSSTKRTDNEMGPEKVAVTSGEPSLKTTSSTISKETALSSDKTVRKKIAVPCPHSCSLKDSSSKISIMHGVPLEKIAACDSIVYQTGKTSIFSARPSSESEPKLEELNPQGSYVGCASEMHPNSHIGSSSSPVCNKHQSRPHHSKCPSPQIEKMSCMVQQQSVRHSNSPGKKASLRIPIAASLSHCSMENHVPSFQSPQTAGNSESDLPTEPRVEETQCTFRPSTSPLTHSSPSQSTPPKINSPSATRGILAGKRPNPDLSPQSSYSSPSLSRLTYVSVNDATVVPTPAREKTDCSMALSTTIIRFSPTPPVEQDPQSNENICSQSKSLEVQPKHSQSLEQLPAQHKTSETSSCRTNLSCARSQSECCPSEKNVGLLASCRDHKNLTESNVKQLSKVDSGYSSNSHIPQNSTTAASQTSEQWAAASMFPSLFSGGLGIPQSYSSDGLPYGPIKIKPPYPGLIDFPHQPDMKSLLAGSLVNSQLTRQYLGPDAPLNSAVYHVGATATGLQSASSSDMTNGQLPVRQIHPIAQSLGIGSATGSHHLTRSTHSHQDVGLLGKFYSQYGGEPMVASGLDELRVQVVVPEELQFPHACCVGIASQTSLSIFNPSERWQQVSITVASLSIDGEKLQVDTLPYQWLIIKNKTIIGPKSTEEQKVLFIPPKAGVYQCALSVCSWPASANTELANRASIFARRVVLVAIAESPSVEVEAGKSGCLDFGDLPEGSSKSLLLKVINMTQATVPIRLVISAATSWRCFTLSKQHISETSEATQPTGHVTPLSAPSLVNHVMHASFGENPECFMVWVHFKALQKYTTSSGDLGQAEEYNARVDVEVDSPGASHVIKSVPIRARSGTARVHAPKDVQNVSLRAPLGKSSQKTLPLKNAGNIGVWLKLKCNEVEDCFSVKPDELFLAVGEEQGVVVSFNAWGPKKYKESLLNILVLPSGPQYELKLKGEIVSEESGINKTSAASVLNSCLSSDVPPILSNKQFVAWGGVTLGRAVQQKLVLRNNSSTATQQLRLLIRGQDQDCFQLQSLFSPDERMTRHGELSIRPREDVTVHLLFAPTRVACMLAKLEIKQSGVRPSQPTIKFTIPLSGYGGTSNIILEDQRKQADGYVATMSDIAINHLSKVCLYVRNTGSRAAFVKAVAFSDVMTRSVMDPFIISLSPSQFVLKERTQEAITVLLKSTQREQTLCQSDSPLLATIVLFCGDEISRQQFRRLLESKPDAGQKVLAENNLLKNVEFNEKFHGEEVVTEPFNLPQRPNEAYIFYGNMCKIAVSLLGYTLSKECEQSDTPEMMNSSSEDLVKDSGITMGNVSLDVLPVKGPQGPTVRVSGSSLKTSESPPRLSETWTVHPEQLVLAAPTMNAVASTNQVQIKNNTMRELSFDLAWPAHYLTITPQHGVIEPQCHLQILISPKPSLASKSDMLPWNGKIYVQCDGQQKLIKVQIRRDLALDVSTTPANATLSALSPQASTPVLPTVRITSKSTLPMTSPQLPPALLEIINKNIIFPNTPSGETSEAQLEVENGHLEVRWYISSFAPPYVKGVDNSCDVYRATYTAFRCSKVSGTLGANEKIQVPITFLPRDGGDYAQFWDLECHPVSEPQQKSRIRFQLCGTGINSAPGEVSQNEDCSLVKTEATVKTRKKAEASTSKTSQDEGMWRGVYTAQDLYTFPNTRVGEFSTLKVNICNNSPNTHELRFVSPREPFHIKHSKYSLRSQHFLKLPVQFKPSSAGRKVGLLLIQSETSGTLVVQLTAEALP